MEQALPSFTNKVKSSSLFVYNNAKHVKINFDKLNEFVNKIDSTYFAKDEFLNYFNNHLSNIKDHSKISYEELIAYVCVVDSLNFCFWPLEKEYNEENNNKINFEYDDYVSNLNKIYENNKAFFLAENLEKVNFEILKKEVFSGLNFPLLEERVRSLNELGSFIKTQYNGKFSEFVMNCEYDCEKVSLMSFLTINNIFLIKTK